MCPPDTSPSLHSLTDPCLHFRRLHLLPAGSAMSDHDLTVRSLLMCVDNEGLSAAQWEEIGVQLGLPHGELKNIEYAYHHRPEKCLIEVVWKWLNSNITPSEEEFLQALK